MSQLAHSSEPSDQSDAEIWVVGNQVHEEGLKVFLALLQRILVVPVTYTSECIYW